MDYSINAAFLIHLICTETGIGYEMMISVKQRAIQTARYLRKNQTEAENVFWIRVKNRNVRNLKFLRQHPLYFNYYGELRFFIADFYCKSLNLVLEIDGGIHELQEDYDQIRTQIIESQINLKVIRFKNEEIIHNIDEVMENLIRLLL